MLGLQLSSPSVRVRWAHQAPGYQYRLGQHLPRFSIPSSCPFYKPLNPYRLVA